MTNTQRILKFIWGMTLLAIVAFAYPSIEGQPISIKAINWIINTLTICYGIIQIEISVNGRGK